MTTRRVITITIAEDNVVRAMWPDGTEHSCRFPDETNGSLYSKIMADLTFAMFPVLRGAGDPNYGDKYGKGGSHMQPGEDTLLAVQNYAEQENLEVKYWQGEWTIRRSGETKEYKSEHIAEALIMLNGGFASGGVLR